MKERNRNKGFTLIELLAVIVILAVIALISTPIIIGVIDKARKGAFENTAYGILDAGRLYFVKSIGDTNSFKGKTFDFSADIDELKISGEKPKAGFLSINSNGEMSLIMSNGEYCVSKEYVDNKVKTTEVDTCLQFEEIKKAEDLVKLSQEVNNGDSKEGKKYILLNTIDFLNDASYISPAGTTYGDINGDGKIEGIKSELTTGTGFNPIGNQENKIYFKGDINGFGHKLENLYINRKGKELQSLILRNDGGTIENLTVEGTVTTDAQGASLLVGVNYGDINNCKVRGKITGTDYIGGISAQNRGTIKNSHTDVTITGNRALGGLVGQSLANYTIRDSSVTANITGSGWIGGLVGNSSSKIVNSYTKGSVQGTTPVGGLVGMQHTEGSIENSYSEADIVSNDGHVGGLVGMIGSTDTDHSKMYIKNCYSTGSVKGLSESGGLVGQNGASSENEKTKYILIQNSYALGNVETTGGTAGGLVGSNIMNIENSFATGNAKSTGKSGSIIGNQENASATSKNTYYKEGQTIIGTSTGFGIQVSINNLKQTSWYKNTLKLGNHFQYQDGYYPLLYKQDVEGKPTKNLVSGQIKREVK